MIFRMEDKALIFDKYSPHDFIADFCNNNRRKINKKRGIGLNICKVIIDENAR